MNGNTARALSAAVKRVMCIDPDWESKDVSKIDPDEQITRFINLSSREFKPESLQAYARRFKQALSLFMEFQRDPSNWKPSGVISPSKKARAPKPDSQKEGFQGSEGSVIDESEASTTQSFMEYPFPLRESCVVRLRLPSDLKVSEVERLSAFMKALAIDFSVPKDNERKGVGRESADREGATDGSPQADGEDTESPIIFSTEKKGVRRSFLTP